MDGQRNHSYKFASFHVDTRERLLLRNGEPVPLPPKVYDTLLALVERSGHIIGKDELMRTVWPDTFVEDANLTVNISALRRALGEGISQHQYIETVPRRGYRFVSQVTRVENEGADLLAERRADSRAIGAGKDKVEVEEMVARDDQRLTSPPLKVVESPRRRFSPAVAGLALLLACLSLLAYYNWRKPAAPERKVRSIAVLPFKPLVADSRDEPLEMGMCDALITRLSGLNQLAVRPTSSVVMYKEPGHDPLAVGRELGVDALLDGYVQRSGNKIRVTVQLLSIRDGKHLWSGQFNENFTDIFAVEDSISRQMVEALLLQLTGEEEQQRVTRHPTDNVDAYEDYLKGRYFLDKGTPEGVKKSIQHFQQATEKDSKYALAFAGLAEAYIIQGVRFDMPPQETFQKAKTAALRAIEIDDTNAEAHMALAHIRGWYDWDWLSAESEFKRAIQLSHKNPIETHYYVSYLIAMGWLQEAASEIRQAQRLAPLSLSINVQLARTLYFARQYDEAIAQCRKTLELEPDFGGARLFLGRLYKQKRMYKEALAELEKARELLRDNRESDLLRDNAEVLSIIGYTYAASGQRAEALKILQELQRQANHRYVSPYHVAMVYAGLGERDKAFSWLGKAFEDREGRLTILKVVPEFDSLRSDPRFADLLRRISACHKPMEKTEPSRFTLQSREPLIMQRTLLLSVRTRMTPGVETMRP